MKLKTTMMKLILAALTIYQASAAFVCGEECAVGIYTGLKAAEDLDNGMTDLDLAIYGYIIYTNVAEAGNADLTVTFMAGVGEACELDDNWTRAQVADCFNDATDEDVEEAQAGFEDCDAANNDGCSRIMGILAHQFAPDGKIAAAFDSELTGSNTADAINVYTTFMAVIGSWDALGTECQDAITEAAGYEDGDDVVLSIANGHEEIVAALGEEPCADSDDEDIAAAVTALTSDLEDAVTLADKLTAEVAGEDADAESSAAVLSAVAGLIAFML